VKATSPTIWDFAASGIFCPRRNNGRSKAFVLDYHIKRGNRQKEIAQSTCLVV
jgi:hypothetical protein